MLLNMLSVEDLVLLVSKVIFHSTSFLIIAVIIVLREYNLISLSVLIQFLTPSLGEHFFIMALTHILLTC